MVNVEFEKYLITGNFILLEDGVKGVIVNNTIVYENGYWDWLFKVKNAIVAIFKCPSFKAMKSTEVVWQREN